MHLDEPAIIPRHTVGGTETFRLVHSFPSGQIELVRRRSNRPFEWHHRQPLPMLLWLRSGLMRYRLEVGGIVSSVNRPTSPSLILIPAHTTVSGEFELGDEADYVVFFIEKTERTAPLLTSVDEPRLNITDKDLGRTLYLLAREVSHPDDLSNILLESWTEQALAYLSRTRGKAPCRHRGGFTRENSRRIQAYVHAHFAEKIHIDELARVTGISPRHFIRVFSETFHITPMKHILELRIQEAKRRLGLTEEPVTEIAFACGFSHAQHFSTAFRAHVGTTPSAYRRAVRQ